MPELSIKDQLNKLIELQKRDLEIYEKKQDLIELPLIIDKLKNEFESSKTRLAQLQENEKGVLVARKEKELELKEKEDLITKLNAQLSTLKTNKEYTAMLKEIEGVKADMSVIEEKILLSYDDVDKINGDIEKEKGIVAQREAEFNTKKKEIEDQIKSIESRISEVNSSRNELLPEIDKTVLARYERILSHKEGVAITPIIGSACGGCNMNLTPQIVNAVKLGEELYECEICSRILYLEDED